MFEEAYFIFVPLDPISKLYLASLTIHINLVAIFVFFIINYNAFSTNLSHYMISQKILIIKMFFIKLKENCQNIINFWTIVLYTSRLNKSYSKALHTASSFNIYAKILRYISRLSHYGMNIPRRPYIVHINFIHRGSFSLTNNYCE